MTSLVVALAEIRPGGVVAGVHRGVAVVANADGPSGQLRTR